MSADTQRQQVSLGCGTLILIALIVLIFSGDNEGLKTELGVVKKQLDEQAREIERLHGKIDRLLKAQEPEGRAP